MIKPPYPGGFLMGEIDMLVIKPCWPPGIPIIPGRRRTLGNHRKWSTLVHPMDIDETNAVASIANITRVLSCERAAQML